MNVQLEVFFTKIDKETLVYLRKAVDISKGSEDPDVSVDSLVEQEAENLQIDKERCIIHSTSWRYVSPDAVVLTYVVYSDFMELGGAFVKKVSFSDLTLSRGTATQPSPQDTKEENVVAHALRHLSMLVQGDLEMYKNALTTSSIQSLKGLALAPAGKMH